MPKQYYAFRRLMHISLNDPLHSTTELLFVIAGHIYDTSLLQTK